MERPLSFEKDGSVVVTKEIFLWFEMGPYGMVREDWLFFLNLVFKWCVLDFNIYALHINCETLILTLLVDDVIIIGTISGRGGVMSPSS